ncbi:MAG: MFS transporter [Armatimonadetes bacterium]|nr:MFS transporter [Armatimonadota bacterium]
MRASRATALTRRSPLLTPHAPRRSTVIEELDYRAPWRRTLYVVWVAGFIAVSGMSLVTPFLPLYLLDLGVKDVAQAQRWAGLLVSGSFICAAMVAPVWGSLADRYGRKPMALRAIFGLAVSISLMAFATRPEHLLLLRMLQGSVGGFVSASIALVATAVPRARLGAALGTLQTSLTAGHVVGPLFGGVLADRMGYNHVFLITGGCCVLAGLVVAVFVKEDFTPLPAKERHSFRQNLGMLRTVPALRATFMVMFVTQIGLMVIQPVLALFIRDLAGGSEGLLRTKVGVVFSMPGLAAVVAAPLWGRRGDRIGHRTTLAMALLGAGVLYLPQAWAQTATQLAAMRFFVGLCMAGVSPSAHSVVASSVASNRTAAALSLLSMAQWSGSVAGPLLGGLISSHLGARPIFLITAVLLLCSGTGALRAARKPVKLLEPAAAEVGEDG